MDIYFSAGEKTVSQFHIFIVIYLAFKNHTGFNDFFFFFLITYIQNELTCQIKGKSI